MKQLFKFMFAFLMVAIFANQAYTQTYIERNITGKIKRYAKTTKDTTITVDNIAIANGEVGIIHVQAIGINDDAAQSVTGVLRYRYSKTGGTLTLTALPPIDTARATGDISAATFAAASSSNNIKINVAGVANYSIRWAVVTKQWAWVNN